MFRAPQPTVRRSSRRALLLPVLLVTVFAAPPAVAQQIETLEVREYEACMQLVNIEPDRAFERALQMQDSGFGAPARHCAAAALAAGGHHEEAAKRFEALAADMPDSAPASIVANILGHAGISWLAAGKPGQAYSVQTAALDLAPRSADILVDRAMTLDELDRLWEAVDDLDAALEIDPGRVDAHVLRASAYRQLDVLDLAMESVNRALKLEPDDPEGLLERGIIHRLNGDLDAARADWIKVIELHDGRPAAEMARRNLDRLDFGPPEEDGTQDGQAGENQADPAE
ncbi:tetratricopeptide repeat protein [Marivibrio halodurans]|uniref:Tetratricopeptide repeat protein n=1 Tax=Marivibrio halodurans TaxID=2039722 RepID=A0A8J7SAY8_9PROT|nr:tetratricopeptide repeat protein [Marivibrio halodurans]MBP5858682.1 tetratricopeptide repeat protein [Marivibrio halodurans]